MEKRMKNALSLLAVMVMFALLMPISALAEETNTLASTVVEQEGIGVNGVITQTLGVPAGIEFGFDEPIVTEESGNDQINASAMIETKTEASYYWPTPGNTNITQYYGVGHKAIDISPGNDVCATKSGTVVKVYSGCTNNNGASNPCTNRGGCSPNAGYWSGWCNSGYGNGVVINHEDGTYSHYAHLLNTFVSVGQNVSQGTVIGMMGSTGCSYGKHLHFAVSTSPNAAVGELNTNPGSGINYTYNITPADTTPPSISNVQIIDVNAEGFTVRCNVSDNVGVTAVKFPTWTNVNGQDDLIWHENGTNGNEAAYRVLYSDHKNERGDYTVHIYAYDAAGNQSNTGTSISIDATPPVISDVQIVDQNSTGYTVKLKATDESGIDRVQFPTWTPAGGGDGRDDLLPDWPTNPAARGTIEGDTVTFRVNDSAHNFEKGEYITHIYAYDKFGNATCYPMNSIILENSDTPIAQENLGSHEYQLFDDAMNWPEAKAKAEALGGHLVTITSQDEQSLIEKMLQSGQREAYFIGGTDEGHEGTFTWITGEVFGLAKWAGGQPDNYSGIENCLEILRVGLWNDNSNTAKRGFIVEKESAAFSVKSFTADKASGQTINTPINLTAAGSDGATPYQYKFYYMLGSTAIVIRDFSTTDTAVFKPTLKGDYTLYVEVKDAQGHTATKSMVMKINDAGGGGSESKLISYLGKDSGGSYYRYSATEFNNSFLAYQINPALASAKMYQQYLNSQCKIVGLEDQAKGYMDYNATASACLKAQIWGQTFDINVYFASSYAKVFEEPVENVRIVDKDGNIS